MGKIFEAIDEKLSRWIGHQRLFFVATAPSGSDGHVNCSPKGGIETFRIVDPHTVAYLDFVGSGIETIAHLRENGRIVIMFCAFEGPPRIVRLHGRGTVTQVGDPAFEELKRSLGFDGFDGADGTPRAIITVAVERIADSCGYGVPQMTYEGTRTQMAAWTESQVRKRGPNAVLAYAAKMNQASLDGLAGIEVERLPV